MLCDLYFYWEDFKLYFLDLLNILIFMFLKILCWCLGFLDLLSLHVCGMLKSLVRVLTLVCDFSPNV